MMNLNSKILVTGATGVVGIALQKELLNNYNNCLFVGSKDYNLISLYETQELFEEYRPDYVFHLAGCVYGILGNLNNKGKSFYNNLMINTNVVECCKNFKVKKVLCMGTGAMYGIRAQIPLKEIELFNGRPHLSEYSYAQAKRAMLSQLEAYNFEYGLDFVCPISCNLFGEGDRFNLENGHVIPMLIRKFRAAYNNNTEVEVWGDGKIYRDFLYSKDVARLLILLMNNYSGVANIGSGTISSIDDIVNILSNLTQVKYYYNNKLGGQRERLYDLSIIKNLGFNSKCSLEAGLIYTYNWFVKNELNFRE